MLDAKTKKYLGEVRQAGLIRSLSASAEGVLNFCQNDYLGLSQKHAVTEKAMEYLQRFGTSAAASRVLGGNMPYHVQLEESIAKCYQDKQALIFSCGFQANATIISALVNEKLHGIKSLVLADSQCHNSMITGCQLGGSRIFRYRHQDLQHLESLLQRPTVGPRFIMTETVFSMSGTITDIDKVIRLAQKYNAYTIIDDAHGIGVIGPQGYSTVKEHINEIDIVVGTFSKALGSFGAYCICSQSLKDYLINACRGFIYTTAPSPAMVGAMQAGWDLIPHMHEARDKLKKNVACLKKIMKNAGWEYNNEKSSIIAVYNCNNLSINEAYKALLENKILVGFVRPPTTAMPILRITLSSQHSNNDLEYFSQVIDKIKL